MVCEFKGKPEENSITERAKCQMGAAESNASVRGKRWKTKGRPVILVMKWSVVVFDSGSITKLCPHSSASYRGWICYVVLRRACSIQAMGRGPTHAS